eukprot:236862_1
MWSRSKKPKMNDITKRSQMYLDSKEATKKQFKILSIVGFVSIIVLLLLYKFGLFSRKSKMEYIVGSTTQTFEESTNKLLSSWGSSHEALKFANLPSIAQGYLTVNAMVIQKDNSVKKQGIQIFYREASKLNPGGFGIANKLQRLHKGFLGGIKKGIETIEAIKKTKKSVGNAANLKKKADENMDDYVIDKDVTLLFLHGENYLSSTWEELGTLDYFAKLGYKVYGIDMPGYGHSQNVVVKTNEWLIDLIIKLLSSQDEEGNIDQDGGEHHTDSHEKNKDAIQNEVAPSTKKIHKICIISPDISGTYTFELLGNHKTKLGENQGLMLEKYISVDAMNISSINTDIKNSDVQICNIVGENDISINHMENLQTVTIEGASKYVYLDKPDIFHNIISTFLATGNCKIDFNEGMQEIN